MQGRRVEFRQQWDKGDEPKPGDYWLEPNGNWAGVCPDGQFCNLAKHTVVEHGNYTISVTPSILCGDLVHAGGKQWHGYLTCGIWTEC